jgi:hypothetical protein
MPNTTIDPRAMWPLAYLSGRLGWRLTGYSVDGPGKDVISADLLRSDVRVHVDWFPRTGEALISQGSSLLAVCTTFAELCDALEELPRSL